LDNVTLLRLWLYSTCRWPIARRSRLHDAHYKSVIVQAGNGDFGLFSRDSAHSGKIGYTPTDDEPQLLGSRLRIRRNQNIHDVRHSTFRCFRLGLCVVGSDAIADMVVLR